MRVAIVGSGPAGMYAAGLLAVEDRVQRVDVLDASPAPFGLVRHGVAPDHHTATSVAAVFARTLTLPRVHFRGNVTVGRDVSREELLDRYDAVIYAVGVDGDRELGVPGIIGSLEVVRWYTGVPGATPLDLTGVRTLVVVGGGNVALDVARLALLDDDALRRSTMADSVLEAYCAADVAEVHVVVRRSALDVKFSVPELQELLALPGLLVTLDPPTLPDVPEGLTGVTGRQIIKRDSLFREAAERGGGGSGDPATTATGAATATGAECRHLFFHFGSQVESVALGSEGRPEVVVLSRSDRDDLQIPSELVVSAIGYVGTRVPGVPYDEEACLIPNEVGVVTGNGEWHGREYVVGWAGRGPTGVIGTNKSHAAAAIDTLWEHLGPRVDLDSNADDSDPLMDLLRERGIEVVDSDGWERIRAAEGALGEGREAPTVRINDLEALLTRARGH